MKKVYYVIRRLLISKFRAFTRSFFTKSKKQRVHLKAELKKAKKIAHQAGTSKTEAYKSAQAQFSASCDQEKESLLAEQLQKKAQLEVEQATIQSSLDASDEARYARALEEIQTQLHPELIDILKKIKGARRYYKHFVVRLRKVKSELALSDGPAKKKMLDKDVPFYVLSGLTATAESLIMVSVFEAFLDLTLLMAIVTSLLLSSTTILFSELVGSNYKNGGWRLRSTFILILCSFIFMSTVRIAHDPQSAIVSVPALALLYSAGVTLAIRRYTHSEHFEFLKEEKSIFKKMSALEEKILVYMGNATNLHQKAHCIAEENATAYKAQQIKKAIQIEGELRKVENDMAQIEEQFSLIESSGLSEIEASFQQGLEDRFADDDSTYTTASFWKKSVLGFALLLSLLTGCEKLDPENQSFAIAMGRDVSGSMDPDQIGAPTAAKRYLLKKLHLEGEDNDYSNIQVDVTLFEIGAAIRSRTNKVVLESTGNPLLRKRIAVKENIKVFKDDLGSSIVTLFNSEPQAGSTNLYRHLGIQLQDLVNTNATHKLLVVFSDCISESRILQLSNYQKDPKEILTSYNEILTKLDQEIALPDLNGVSIIIVYADTTSSELSYYSRALMKKYYQSKGAAVTMLSNL
jgi:hypothetical protein